LKLIVTSGVCIDVSEPNTAETGDLLPTASGNPAYLDSDLSVLTVPGGA
jgi:hypothetical protein